MFKFTAKIKINEKEEEEEEVTENTSCQSV
jgi:hypothetical protein